MLPRAQDNHCSGPGAWYPEPVVFTPIRGEQLTLDSMLAPVHKVRGGGPVHEWDCEPCLRATLEREEDLLARNPYKEGTKLWKRYREQVFMDTPALDPRYETYWSM
jgi:hypothetical protein